MSVIGFQQMLAFMDRTTGGQPVEFRIVFLRSGKRGAGTLKTVKRCRRLGHAAGHYHLAHGTIPLYDVVAGRPCTPVLDHIVQFNGQKVMM